MAVPKEKYRAHHGLAVNVGRTDAGAHKENMFKYVDKMPARGTTGPGKVTKGENALHGGKYATGAPAKHPVRPD